MSAFDCVRTRRPLLVALIIFVLAGAAAAAMIWHGEQHNPREQRTRAVNLATDHAKTVQRDEVQAVAQKIIAAVAAPFQLGSQQQNVEIGTSIGISIYPSDGQDADTLVNAADTAMSDAKQVGSSFRFGAPDS